MNIKNNIKKDSNLEHLCNLYGSLIFNNRFSSHQSWTDLIIFLKIQNKNVNAGDKK